MIRNPSNSRFSFVIHIVFFTCTIVSLAVLFGWFFNIEVLKSIVAGASTMKINTALCFSLLGWVLFSSQKNGRPYAAIGVIFPMIVCTVGFLTFLSSILNLDFGIDELFKKDTINKIAPMPFPGRMSRTTSFSFMLISLGFLAIRSQSVILKTIAQYVFHLVSLIAFITLIGYVFNIPDFHSFGFLESMAIHTAFLFLILSIVATLLNPTLGITSLFIGNSIGSIMIRKIFPISLITIIILGFIRILMYRYSNISVEFGFVLFMFSFLFMILIILGRSVKYLNKIDLKRYEAENSLQELNNSLEKLIAERTRELKISEEKFFKVFHLNPAGMILSDIDSKQYLEVNKGFTRLTGFKNSEIIGKSAVEIGVVSKEEREKLTLMLNKRGRLINHEIAYYNKKGEKKAGLLSVETIQVLDKRYGLTIIHDITERKELEETILEASKTKERFMANMSHEIRTPMNAIIGFTNLIEKKDLSETNIQYLDYIKSSGENLLVLINDILDYSKIEAGMMLLENIPFNIKDLIQSVTMMFSVKSEEKNLKLELVIDSKLPNLIKGDPTRLTQILINLIGNAIKFTEKGNIDVKAQLLSIENDFATIMLSVKDTGKGIPKNLQHKIFERFVQASTETTRDFGGSGLGLAIVKNLVQMQDGKIEINSTENVGTEFTVTLSYKIENDDTKMEFEKREQENILKFEKFEKEIKILLTEDNKLNQLIAKNILIRYGCTVDIAENGAIAVEMLTHGNYDLVLMDIQMPIMDGYTASQKIRAEVNKTIPIIAMTAHVMTGEKEKCLSFGMNDYISKPFETKDLYQIIQKYTQVNQAN